MKYLTLMLILDEIGECQRAVTSLKYFAEKAPEMYVAASGSNIGLLNSFPVGKVEQLNLRPLTFYEFLLAKSSRRGIGSKNHEKTGPLTHRYPSLPPLFYDTHSGKKPNKKPRKTRLSGASERL